MTFEAGEVLFMKDITPDMIRIMDELIDLEKEVYAEKIALNEKVTKINELRGLMKLQPYTTIKYGPYH